MSYPLFHPRSTAALPTTLSAQEFQAAFPAENEYVEFKQGLSTKELRRAVVAFSNTDGGVIVLGVLDDGSVKGFSLSSNTNAQLNNDVLRVVVNPGRYQVHQLAVSDESVVIISIAKREEGFSQLPDGSVLGRFGASNQSLFGESLVRLVSQQSLGRFETTPTSTPLSRAAADLMNKLAAAWGWHPNGAHERMIEHGLAAPNSTGAVLTVAGALHVLDEPHTVLGKTFVEVFRYRGGATAPDRRIEIAGPLAHQIEAATSAVMDEIGTDFVVIGTHRHDLPRLPEVVLREAIANAVAHRSYEANGTAVRIDLHDDRVVVNSPGGLPEPVTVSNIREQYAARNLAVIDTLRRFGLAEDAGHGVDVMQDEMANELLDPPEFVDTGTSVVVTLRTTGSVTPHERAWVDELELSGSLSAADRLVLVHAARGAELNNSAVRNILGVDSVQARQSLQRLRDARLLAQRGERGGATYVASVELGAPAGLRLSDAQLEAIVLELAQEGPISNATVRERLRVDRLAALRLLTRLTESDQLERHGQKRGTYYTFPGAMSQRFMT